MTYRAHLIMVAVVALAACGDDTSFDQAGRNDAALGMDSAFQGKAGRKVGGTVSGLAGMGLVLELNGDATLAVQANGRFYFAQKLSTGATYSVTVKTQPTSVVQTCTVSKGVGIVVDENVKSIVVGCSPTGSYRETGDLSFAPRYLHTATRLRDGRVLVAGGHPDAGTRGADATASAELYDLETGTFTPTGNMTQGRCGHTATLLPDGKVLIVGGWTNWWELGWSTLASAELYDPNTGSFRPVGTMRSPRTAHSATLLASGKVLVVAGYIYDVAWGSRAAEIYDPATESFTETGSPYAYRWDHSATLLDDGRVLIVGGNGSFIQGYCYYDGVLQDCMRPTFAELYDPATGAFARLGDVSGIYSTALLSSGKVLVAGWNRALLYDPATEQFSDAGAQLQPLPATTATLLRDGTVLLTGGSASALFDPGTLAFTPTGGLEAGMGADTATLLRNGKVLVVDGNSSHAYLYETIPPIE